MFCKQNKIFVEIRHDLNIDQLILITNTIDLTEIHSIVFYLNKFSHRNYKEYCTWLNVKFKTKKALQFYLFLDLKFRFDRFKAIY